MSNDHKLLKYHTKVQLYSNLMCDSEENFVPVLACHPVLIGKGKIQKFL